MEINNQFPLTRDQYQQYPPPNYGEVGKTYEQETPNNADAQGNDSWAFTQIHFSQDSQEFTTYGLRYEKSAKAYQAGFIRFDGIAGVNATGNTTGGILTPGIGAKAAIQLGSIADVYGTAMGTANVGYICQDWTAGVGTRVAAGVNLNLGKGSSLYGELFQENATNYDAQGYAVGFKRFF